MGKRDTETEAGGDSVSGRPDARMAERQGGRAMERYRQHLEWTNRQIAMRDREILAIEETAREHAADLERQLRVRGEELAATRDELAAVRQEQRANARHWARAARGIEGSRSWRLGSLIIRTLRRLAFRPAAPRGGPRTLAEEIESSIGPERSPVNGGD